MNDLNSALTNYKKEVAEKDSKLVDYQKQLQSLTGKEDELFKQIADYKNKNNVSTKYFQREKIVQISTIYVTSQVLH